MPFLLFFCLCVSKQGLEGRVLNDSPGDCQIAPPLRPQAGETLRPCQKPSRTKFEKVFTFSLLTLHFSLNPSEKVFGR